MSRRKDNKGRVLRTGESQRKDLIYQYRYTDALGNRKCIYASDLKILREKEDELQRSLEDGLDYAGGEITVYELLQRYLSLKCGVRYNTKVGYGFVMNIVQKEPFGARKIRDIKVSDAQRWMIKLQKEGKGYSTLTSIRGVVKPAFQMAYNEEIVRRNPFDFKLTDVVVNDSQKRISLTEKQQKVWMNFIREDKSYAKYYDEFVVLLGTGMRVSEFCGLTLQDLDFQNRKIRVDHQLIWESGGKYYVEKTKTECGRRFIPMAEAIANMVISIVLAKRYGIAGVLFGTLVSFLALSFWAKPYFVCRDVFEVSFARYAVREGREIVVSVLVAAGTWYAVSLVSLENVLLSFGVKALLALALSNGLLLLVYFKTSEFQYLRGLLESAANRIGKRKKA